MKSHINEVKRMQELAGILKEDAPIYRDWDEFVNPHYIIVHLNDGKKLKIGRSRVKGGNAVYHAILKAFNDNNYKITNKVVGAMLDKLRDKDEEGKELGRMGGYTSESINEGKYYIGYNKGRGQGKGVFKDTYSTYEEAQKEVEKIQKMMVGSYNMTAYYVADSKGEIVMKEQVEGHMPEESRKLLNDVEESLKTNRGIEIDINDVTQNSVVIDFILPSGDYCSVHADIEVNDYPSTPDSDEAPYVGSMGSIILHPNKLTIDGQQAGQWSGQDTSNLISILENNHSDMVDYITEKWSEEMQDSGKYFDPS